MRALHLRQVAVGLAVLGSLAAAPAPRAWDVPDVIEAVEVPGRTVTGGVPVSMRAVRSKRDAESLQQWFRSQFAEAGLWLGPQTQLSVHRQVTGFDVDTLVAYSVFLQENRDKTTTVIMSETFMAEKTAPGEVKFAPLMPGATGVLSAHTEGTELAVYRVKAKPAEVKAFYGDTLAKAGWAARDGRFERGAELLDVQAKAKGPETAVTLTLRQR
jgi:hypothetical protein